MASGGSPLEASAALEGGFASPTPGAFSPSAGGPCVSADMTSPQQQALSDITKPCQGAASETAADEDSGPHPGSQAASVLADSLMQAPATFDTDGVDVVCLQPAQVRVGLLSSFFASKPVCRADSQLVVTLCSKFSIALLPVHCCVDTFVCSYFYTGCMCSVACMIHGGCFWSKAKKATHALLTAAC